MQETLRQAFDAHLMQAGRAVMFHEKEISAPGTAVVVATSRQGGDVTNPRVVEGYIKALGPAYARRTQELLASDWKAFSAWCRENGRPSFPTSPETVVAYLVALSSFYQVSTLRRHLATLSHLHNALGEANPVHSQVVRLTLRGIARTSGGRPEGRRAPLRQGDIEAMIGALGSSLRDLRDKALLLVARDSLARRAELARLAIADVDFRKTSGDARAIVRRSKGDSEARSVWLAPETCAALRAWLKRADITSGIIFRRVHMDGRVGDPLLGQAIARRFKRLAEAAGLDSTRISSHSTRIGMCCDLVGDGHSLVAIQLAGGWRSPSMPGLYAAELMPELGAVARYYAARGSDEAAGRDSGRKKA